MPDPTLDQSLSRNGAPLTRGQWGWIVTALVAFLGVAVIGPAATSAAESGRDLHRRTRRRLRQLGGGTIRPLRRRMAAPRR